MYETLSLLEMLSGHLSLEFNCALQHREIVERLVERMSRTEGLEWPRKPRKAGHGTMIEGRLCLAIRVIKAC